MSHDNGTDYMRISGAIADTMKRAGLPLKEDQKIMLSGALAVWIDKVIEETKLNAAPSTAAEQASDVRITSATTTAIAQAVNVLERIERGRMPLATRHTGRKMNVQDIAKMVASIKPELVKAQFNILSCYDETESRKLKSDTPADTGNAPVEAILSGADRTTSGSIGQP